MNIKHYLGWVIIYFVVDKLANTEKKKKEKPDVSYHLDCHRLYHVHLGFLYFFFFVGSWGLETCIKKFNL